MQKKRLFRPVSVGKDACWVKKTGLILDKTVLAIAQAEQFAATEEEENLVIPNEFPQDAADAHLVFGGKLVVGIGGVHGVGHRMVVDGLLPDLEAQVDEGDAVGVFAAFDELEDAVLQVLVVEKDVDWIWIVVHGFMF